MPRTPSFRLDGRRALVTGAGRGIGLACAAALAQAGAEVWLAARSGAEVEAAAVSLRGRGDRANAVVLDVTDTAAVARTVAAHGPFQVLVNNAGSNRPKPMEEVSEDDFDALYRLNVRAAFFVAREVARGLKAAGLPGSIVQMSSQMGHVGAFGRTAYCATKHALEGLSKALALELGPHRIRRLPDLHRHADDARVAGGPGLPGAGVGEDPARPRGHRGRRDWRCAVPRGRRVVAGHRFGLDGGRGLDGRMIAATDPK